MNGQRRAAIVVVAGITIHQRRGAGRGPCHTGRVLYAAQSLIGARNVTPVELDRCVNDGDQIGSFMVVHTPGHTPGHICLLRDDSLFSGDLLQAISPAFRETPHILTADVPTSRVSIRKVAGLEFQAILSSDNPPYVFRASERVRALAAKFGGKLDS